MWTWISRAADLVQLNQFSLAGSVVVLAGGLMLTTTQSMPPWVAYLGALGAIIVAALVFRLFQRRREMREVVGETFQNTAIVLDGHNYVDCVFRDVTMKWNGGLCAFLRLKIHGVARLETDNPTVANTIDILKQLGWLRQDFADDWRRRSRRR